MSVIAPGLPNITGTIQAGDHNSISDASGAFYFIRQTSSQLESGSAYLQLVGFDASYSNEIYGNANTVQPPAIVLIPQIMY